LAEFHASYAADRLKPIDLDERPAVAGFGSCLACGLCNAGEAMRVIASRGMYLGPMDLALASSRSMPDADAALRSFAAVDDAALERVEAMCPGFVPLRRLAAFVRRHGA
jgi:succinate dehydrogenase/fumarate reductase-like Fe-S protein